MKIVVRGPATASDITSAERVDDPDRLRKLDGLIAEGAELNARDKRGTTALHSACLSGEFAAGELLVRHGADVTARDGDGATPFHGSIDHTP